MEIRIESLSVNGLGPISSLKWKFDDVNFIYGKNEQGKTFLVEFLLRSLFRNSLGTRGLTDSGQIVVSGLGRDPVLFHPKSRTKLEDYISSEGDKPLDLARLCVVKGGELSFLPHEDKSITKSVLKGYLSDQRTLDVIQKGIPITIQESSWENGRIIPRKQVGSIKDLSERLEQLKKIDELLIEVDSNYMQGELRKARIEEDEINKLISGQITARRAYAWSISQQLEKTESELSLIPQSELEEARNLLVQIESKKEIILSNHEKINDLEPKCIHYEWLKTAIEECEKRPTAFSGRIELIFVIISILAIAASVVFAFLKYPFISLGMGLTSVLFLILAVIQYRLKLSNRAENNEVNRIFTEFESKFGGKARSIAALKSVLENLTPKYFSLLALQKQVEEEEQQLTSLNNSLDLKIASLQIQKETEEIPSVLINNLEKKRVDLLQKLNAMNMELAATQVLPEEYLPEKVKVQFNPSKLQQYEKQKVENQKHIDDLENSLHEMRRRLSDITNDLFTVSWDSLVDHLLLKRQDVSQRAKALKSEIGSGIIVSQVLTDFRQREDESITRALSSPGISGPIHSITHQYEGVELEGNELIAYNAYTRFPVSELSTGAQEQILLALRIGITSQILKEQKMFLILDDAFQHSDWERREWLVDEMGALANLGWQIIYFSMDDHIKSLFEKRLRPRFKDRYKAYELNLIKEQR